jgi:drug/metabolite transporter (DMT)-like permease
MNAGGIGGPALMMLAVLVFVVQDAVVKWLVGSYGVLQIVAMRTLVSLAVIAAAAWWVGPRGPRGLRTRRPWMHLLRGVLLFTSSATFFYGFRYLPLADAYTIFYLVPLAMTVLAAATLGERIPRRAVVAVALGMAGVGIVVGPDLGGGAALAYAACMLGTLSYGFVGVITRQMSADETPLALIFYPCLAIVLGTLPVAMLDWTPPALADLALVSLVGLLWPLAHMAFAAALRRAPIARLAPLEYSSILWVVIVDLAVFGIAPEASTLIGSAVIIAACLTLVERGARRAA